mgnify:CR=1 FL=1
MPHPVICYYCGETFDRDREPFIKIQERRYAHKDCAEQSGKDLKELEEYISIETTTVIVIDEKQDKKTYPESYVENNSDFCKIGDQWYSVYCDAIEYDGTSYILKKDE